MQLYGNIMRNLMVFPNQSLSRNIGPLRLSTKRSVAWRRFRSSNVCPCRAAMAILRLRHRGWSAQKTTKDPLFNWPSYSRIIERDCCLAMTLFSRLMTWHGCAGHTVECRSKVWCKLATAVIQIPGTYFNYLSIKSELGFQCRFRRHDWWRFARVVVPS